MRICPGHTELFLLQPADNNKRLESSSHHFTHAEFWRIRIIWNWHIDLDIVRIASSLKLRFHLEDASSVFTKGNVRILVLL